MARKTLVIGLGTTGTTVCNHLIERLEWENGSLERTPWIQFLAVETAEVQGQAVHRTNNAVWTQVARNRELLDVLGNPRHWEPEIDPQGWVHPSMSESIAKMGGHGAGNIRQAGRLGLLYPRHFRLVSGAINERLLRLTSLSAERAQFQYQGVANDPNFPPRRPLPGELPFSLSEEMDVYVVGSLCGGTASGSFIDLAYMIRTKTGLNAYQPDRMPLIGIFAGYPGNGSVNEFGANTYWALREYNHWTTEGIVFKARYVGSDVECRQKPYDEFHVVTPATDAKPDVARLNATVADYIYARTFFPEAEEVDAARSDFGNGYTTLARNGAPQQFATFGVSGIEFPARRLVEACQLRLIEGALQRWLTERPAEELEAQGLRSQVQGDLHALGIYGDGLLSRLLAARKGEAGILERIQDHIHQRAVTSGGNLAELQECDTQIEIALGVAPPGDVQAASHLPYGCVRDTVAGNREHLKREVRAALAAKLRGFFLDPDRGVSYCRAYCRIAEDFLSTEMKRHQPDPSTGRAPIQEEILAAKSSKDAVTWEVEAVNRDGFLKALWGRGWAIPRVCEEWSDATQQYYRLWVADLQREACLEIMKLVYEALQRYGLRLRGDRYAPLYLAECRREFSERLRDALNAPHLTNYEAVAAVTEESVAGYFKEAFEDSNAGIDQWKEAARAAEVELLVVFESLSEAVFNDPSTDKTLIQDLIPTEEDATRLTLDVRPDHHLGLLARARRYFEGIESEHILKKLKGLGQTEALRLTQSMLTRSRPQLALTLGDGPRFEDLPMKRAGFLFYNGQGQAEQNRTEEVRVFSNLLREVGEGSVRQAESVDRHRVTVIREQTAFPLAVVDGFLPDGVYARFAANAPRRATYASRSDLPGWHPIDPNPATDDVVRWLLVLVATGQIRAAEMRFPMPNPPSPVQFSRNLAQVRIEFAEEKQHGAAGMSVQDRRKHEIRTEMRNAIFRHRQQHGPEELVLQIQTFIKHAGEAGLEEREGQPLTTESARDWLLPYLRADTELWQFWQAAGNPPVQVDPQILWRAAGQSIPNGHAQADGYYCDKCGYRFGADARDVTEAETCVGCRKAFVIA